MTETKRRTFVGFRIGVGGLAAIDGLAAELRSTRSQVLRLLLALGLERWTDTTPAQRTVWRKAHNLIDKTPD